MRALELRSILQQPRVIDAFRAVLRSDFLPETIVRLRTQKKLATQIGTVASDLTRTCSLHLQLPQINPFCDETVTGPESSGIHVLAPRIYAAALERFNLQVLPLLSRPQRSRSVLSSTRST